MDAIMLSPPPDQAPYRQFRLGSGAIARPDFAKGGRVEVESEADAAELEGEGWTRLPTLTKRAPVSERLGPRPLGEITDNIAAILTGLHGSLAKVVGDVSLDVRKIADTVRREADNVHDLLAELEARFAVTEGAPANGAMSATGVARDWNAMADRLANAVGR